MGTTHDEQVDREIRENAPAPDQTDAAACVGTAMRGRKRYVLDIKVMEIDAPDDLTDEQIIEGYNLGEIEGWEVDGRIEMEPVE